MGRDGVSFTIYASLSNHNSEQDVIDEALWDELCAKIQKIAAQKKYEGIYYG